MGVKAETMNDVKAETMNGANVAPVEAPKKIKKKQSDGDKKKTGRGSTGYMLFCMEARNVLPKPDVDNKFVMTETSKICGIEWRKLSDINKDIYNKYAKEAKDILDADSTLESKKVKAEFAKKAANEVGSS